MELIAFIVVIVGLVAAVGNAAYLALLNSAASKKGASGSPVAHYVRSRWPVAGITTAGAVLAALFSTGDGFLDVLAILLAAGSGAWAGQSLSITRAKYRGDR
ncbi:hypothetical protein [Actinokineospora sp. NBRC 105648]|uniref:hypothetical protein n=1 Tax=Actinokineospora sp. NBRC 105648 TaxID=3032206 RepID=UPI0024A0DB65|nr:hypothetical protein [Actinokineospora sp. NBRC 105648]GLZ42050.1 hypothetical protein Acsp05_56740 [Actinokineospora sp. NBRC 105648]